MICKRYLSSVRFFNFKLSVRIQKINAVSGKKRDMVKHICDAAKRKEGQ